jgi:hypothetical protein
LLAIGAIATLVIGFQVVAYGATLTGSKFEIDQPDANMVVNTTGNLDWDNVNDTKTQDKPTGGTDDSYKGGVKEDTVCPGQVTGAIPDNKADLRYFGVYQEAGPVAGDPGFLHLFWTRVSEPSGATLMDFEFNKSKTLCTTNGSPNVQRTVGDLLIEYKIEGGTDDSPDITLRRWTGTAWGTATTLPPAEALGAINLSPITAANSDGTLPAGTTSENRTFGEASIDLSAIFQPNKCESFGSAMLKSRAGPPFDSQVKDFIAPNTGINIQNCAQVIIKKETDPDEAVNTTDFSFTKNFNTDPTSPNTFTLKDDGVKDFGKTVLLGGPYTVTESAPTGGYQLKGVDCSASDLGSDPDPTTTTATVSFKLDSATDVLNCTYTNEKPLGALLINKDSSKGGAVTNAGAVFSYTGPGSGGTTASVTDANNNTGADKDADIGDICVEGLAPGEYDITETTPPSGYGTAPVPTDHSATVVTGTNCTTNQPTDANSVTFINPPLADIQVRFRDGGSGETQLTPNETIECDNPTGTDVTTDTDGWDDTLQVNGIEAGATEVTVTCTIPIDP